MNKTYSRALLVCCLWLSQAIVVSNVLAGSHAEQGNPADQSDNPFASGEFHWDSSPPLIEPHDHGEDHCIAIKDPTVVHYDGRWHLFTTLRNKKHSHQIEYTSFVDWKDADQSERHLLELTDGYHCAPQVFYMSAQKKWYLIYQVQDPTRTPSLQPAFSTTDNISNPKSWSKPQLLFDEHPENVKQWIDFWVICDDEKAHLFFTSHVGWMWRSETSLEDFPRNWSRPEVVLKGDIFEASHTYRLKGMDKYITLIEARNGGKRYFKAFTAQQLDGAWSPLATTLQRPLASPHNVNTEHDRWTSSYSHGEFLRSGYDEKLEINPYETKLLFQGVKEDTSSYPDYGSIPWKLGLLTLSNESQSVQATREAEFPYKKWVTSPPIFKAGPTGTFDDVAVKDPTIVYFDDKWHVFYTSKSSSAKFPDGVGYVSANTLEGLANAKRHNLNALVGQPVIAPQIFYYAPQKLWYLVAQTPTDAPRELEPIYLTNPDINDFSGWSKPKTIQTDRQDKKSFWIDFWVICDEEKAHLFYTDHAGGMFRLETSRERFPEGFDEQPEELALEVHGTDEIGPWRLHEASHIYYVKSENKYLALLEAVRPHPVRKNYWDSRNRFMFAVIADSLEGPWHRVEETDNDFMGIPAYVFNRDGSPTDYDQISHPELIRSGHDEYLEVEDYRLQVLYQAFDADDTPADYDYDELPWELSVMRNYEPSAEQRK